MAWIYYDGRRPYSDARYKEPAAPMTFQELPYYDDAYYRGRHEEPAPLMFREPPYYDDGYYRGRYEEPAPLMFREPPYYDDGYYRGRYEEPAPLMFREPPYYDDGYYRGRYEEPAPLMFREPPYYDNGYYRRRHEEPAPITFREPPFYDNGYYRSIFRDQYPGFNHGGHLMPREQVLVRTEDPPLSGWHNPGYPYARYIVECPQHVTTVELYAPQLYSDKRERRVLDCLNGMAGVERVTADQWEKKVVVVGRNLCPNDVLRRLQRVRRMNRSVLWHDR